MIVDDHPLWREALARDLADDGFDVVATAGSAGQALRVAAAARPDVAVVDLQLPDGHGVDVVRALAAGTQGREAAQVLVVSASGEHADVLESVKAGATGYLVKSASPADLRAAVRRTAVGEAVFTPGLAGLVLGEYRRIAGAPPSPSRPSGPALSARETEVLRLVAKGLSSRQIATRLSLSPRTVQNHIQNTLTKLHLHNRVELTRYALRHGLDEDT
jgi:DNA-binding NarL/FixJ family response regulator